jgi:signal transduction histidine kinase
MVFLNLQGFSVHGNLENVLIPCVSLCFLFSNYVVRNLGIVLNMILLISFKIIRYQNIPMFLGEIFDDLTIVITVYGVSLFLGYYYKNDYFSLVEINTELQKQKQIIEQQAVELQKANNTKTHLFSIIAHDLRAPIISLKGLLQLYDNNSITEEGFRTLSKRLHENVNSANLLLDNLLIWSFSQIKDTKPTLIKLKLKSIIEEVVFLYKEAIFSKGIKVTNNFTLDLDILGDEQQIKIIFRNLINNAIKFTNINGSIFINAHQQGESIVTTIEDSGIGIKQEDLEYIFSKPKLNVGTNGENSTGLGLTLCKEMVINHRGTIEINSQLGSGTTVVVQLPIST